MLLEFFGQVLGGKKTLLETYRKPNKADEELSKHIFAGRVVSRKWLVSHPAILHLFGMPARMSKHTMSTREECSRTLCNSKKCLCQSCTCRRGSRIASVLVIFLRLSLPVPVFPYVSLTWFCLLSGPFVTFKIKQRKTKHVCNLFNLS